MSQSKKVAVKLRGETEKLISRTQIALRLLEQLWNTITQVRSLLQKAKQSTKSVDNILQTLVKDFYMLKRIIAIEGNVITNTKTVEKNLETFEKKLEQYKHGALQEAKAVEMLAASISADIKKESEYLLYLHKCLQHLHSYIHIGKMFPKETTHQQQWTRHALEYSKQIVDLAELLQGEAKLPGELQKEIAAAIHEAQRMINASAAAMRLHQDPILAQQQMHARQVHSSQKYV